MSAGIAQAESHTGGCLCGALRFESTAPPVETGYCHCRLCQRSTGAVVLAFASFPVSSFSYTRGQPRHYASSGRGGREFCEHCGTQIAFRENDSPKTVDVNVGCLDRPESTPPQMHIWCQSQLAWLQISDDLIRHPIRLPGGASAE